MTVIRNIYCVGRNYIAHAKELKNKVPTSPFLFMKPTHALVEASGQEIELPGNRGAVHFETELVLRIGRSYEPGLSLNELIDKIGLGIDFTLRDEQDQLKEKRYPWLLAKGFPQSAVVSSFFDFPGLDELRKVDFSLIKNEEEVQRGNIENMIFDIPTIVEFCAEHFGLGEGDLIFTGTPEGVGPVSDGDHLSMLWDDNVLADFHVKLKNLAEIKG